MSISGQSIPLILYAGFFTTWLMFYVQGVYLSGNGRNYSLSFPILTVIAGFVLSCMESCCLLPYHGTGVGIKLSAFVYSFGVIQLLLSSKVQSIYKENKFTRIVAYIGEISFGLYLMHCYVITVIHRFLPISNWLMMFLLTTLISVVAIMIARRIIPTRITKYLGL